MWIITRKWLWGIDFKAANIFWLVSCLFRRYLPRVFSMYIETAWRRFRISEVVFGLEVFISIPTLILSLINSIPFLSDSLGMDTVWRDTKANKQTGASQKGFLSLPCKERWGKVSVFFWMLSRVIIMAEQLLPFCNHDWSWPKAKVITPGLLVRGMQKSEVLRTLTYVEPLASGLPTVRGNLVKEPHWCSNLASPG